MGVQLLDCTLRDGGYVNDWRFGKGAIISILERLIQARVDVIEVGFLDDRRPFDPNRTIQPNSTCFNKVLSGIDRGNSMLVGMIDYGTCALKNISPCDECVLDGIRLIFKQPKMREAVAFGQELMKLGYRVFLQMVSITTYSDRDMLDFVDLVNEQPFYAVSMVDTYGLLHKEELMHYFHLLERNLKPEIRIGYHSHNNFQLAYANTCEVIKRRSKHGILVDGTLYGMGKSAGNAPLELLAMYLNENYDKEYDINQLLEAIDTNILRIYHQKYWGYNLLYFLSAANDCHPNYIDYLLNKKTLSVKAVNEIVKGIPPELKLNYQQTCIEQLYFDYQSRMIASERAINELVAGRKLLLLGPGKTLITKTADIQAYIRNEHPLVISVNCVPKQIPFDAVFISNAKRYSLLLADFMQLKDDVSIIATSNVTAIGKPFDYVLNYANLLDSERVIEDNALTMLLNALSDCEPETVTLAGFDGFSPKANENYYDEEMGMSNNYQRLSDVNKAIARRIPYYKAKMELSFITPSIYEKGG
ncbi:aldolase catalytic domain-containing protein [uncultured Dysosmobacter sp.]|uniref:aldolase catalytic domain-containing protein n=1 Tax=uncultured Dysosmobacter sp. TaxID=2591384 RepID=UPI002613EC04|nr:aldolase catalytic domain-containing protein [uncultured Dysosmobacter sp.]